MWRYYTLFIDPFFGGMNSEPVVTIALFCTISIVRLLFWHRDDYYRRQQRHRRLLVGKESTSSISDPNSSLLRFVLVIVAVDAVGTDTIRLGPVTSLRPAS